MGPICQHEEAGAPGNSSPSKKTESMAFFARRSIGPIRPRLASLIICSCILLTSMPIFLWSTMGTSFKSGPKNVLIVGAGLSGSIIAERIVNSCKNVRVTIIEKRDHIGGNCFDYIDDRTGVRVHKYGIHMFHTVDKGVWKYWSKFTSWIPHEHRALARLESGEHVPVPVNIQTVNVMYNLSISSVEEMDKWLKSVQIVPPNGAKAKNGEEAAQARVGKDLYEKIFKDYTWKQWEKMPADLDASVLERIPVRNNWDDRYFTDEYQALPSKGYTSMFENILDNPKIEVRLNTDYFKYEKKGKYDHTFYTGPIDFYFGDLGLPKLEYRTLSFKREEHNVSAAGGKLYQPVSHVNHPHLKIPYTRTIEYAHLPNQAYNTSQLLPKISVLYHETSGDTGEPYYPVPNPRNQELYEKYRNMAAEEKGVVFVGRLASYKYFDMDDATRNALNVFYDWAGKQKLLKCDLSLTKQFMN